MFLEINQSHTEASCWVHWEKASQRYMVFCPVPTAEVPVTDDGANAASSSEAAKPTEQAGAAGTNETATEKAPEEDKPSEEA